MTDWVELFCGDQLEAYGRFQNNARLVVTFDPMQQISRPPAVTSATFFHEREFDHVHIVSKHDIWYQTPEIFSISEIILSRRGEYESIVTYGNSMGAYGALLISGRVDADIVIAFAPQYSVNPIVMPDERRWNAFIKDNTYIYDNLGDFISQSAKIYLAYDPFCAPDLYHVKALRKLRPFTEVVLPMSGHFPAHYLREIGLLGEFMGTMLSGDNISHAQRKLVRDRRARSKTYFHRLAQTLAMRQDVEGAIRAATRTYILDPEDYESLIIFFNILSWTPKYFVFADIAVRLLTMRHPDNAMFEAYGRDARARLQRLWPRDPES